MEDRLLVVIHEFALDHLARRLEIAATELRAVAHAIERSPHLMGNPCGRTIAVRRLELAAATASVALETIEGAKA